MQNPRSERHPPEAAGSAKEELEEPSAPGSYRIGGVSRLTGVPVTTLRVWEVRHAAFNPHKSAGRHRLYTENDVMRARLLRQLSGAGHSVSSIARMGVNELQRMLASTRATAAPAGPAPAPATPMLSAVVVGAAVAARLNAPGWRQRDGDDVLDVQQVFGDLAEAGRSATGAGAAADILLVRLNAIQLDTFEQLSRTAAHLGVTHSIVLYNFAAETVLDAMRAAGVIVRREPVTDAELAEVIRSVALVTPAEGRSVLRGGAAIPRRRYSEAVLARVATSPGSVLCECPRHIAELITQLGSFEEYSGQCLSNNDEDAQLHAYLRSVSGSARALFEQALDKAARHAGISLAEDGAGPSAR